MIAVRKATGEQEPFSEEKVRSSAKRAGIPATLQDEVVKHVKANLYAGIPTSEIFHHIGEFLQKQDPLLRAKYSLKQAIMELGPTGYPFEDFVAQLFNEQGYETSVRNHLVGKCVPHEIDVVAKKGSLSAMIETKYHNLPGTKTDVRVALYTKARFDDLFQTNNLNQVWLVTNTKATTDAIAYATCMGMKVMSWNYPEGESLRDVVERLHLTPITTLLSLSTAQKQQLLARGIIFCKDVCTQPACLQGLGISQEKKELIFAECSFLAGS